MAGLDPDRQDRYVAVQRQTVDEHFKPSRNLALATDILWISGAVLGAAGITLIVVDPRSASREVSLRVSAGSAALQGSF